MAISTKLCGGIGNMLFITAAIESLAKRFGYETVYPNAKEHFDFVDSGTKYDYNLHANDLPKLFRNFDWHINDKTDYKVERIIKVPFGYDHITDLTNNTMLLGYFQSEEYWGGEREFVQNLFEPSDFILEKMYKYKHYFNGRPCSIHVRRGDYLKFSGIYPPVDMDYIRRARELTDEMGVTHYVVFSDDIAWCRANLKGKEYIFIEPETDYLGVFLMGLCSNKIVANSTYSWWGAYLSPKGGEVIAPKKWFNTDKIDSSHICPWYWRLV